MITTFKVGKWYVASEDIHLHDAGWNRSGMDYLKEGRHQVRTVHYSPGKYVVRFSDGKEWYLRNEALHCWTEIGTNLTKKARYWTGLQKSNQENQLRKGMRVRITKKICYNPMTSCERAGRCHHYNTIGTIREPEYTSHRVGITDLANDTGYCCGFTKDMITPIESRGNKALHDKATRELKKLERAGELYANP